MHGILHVCIYKQPLKIPVKVFGMFIGQELRSNQQICQGKS